MVDAFSPHHSDPWKLALQQFTVVGVAILLVAVVLQRSLAVPDRATLLTIVYLALIPTLLAYGLQLFCQRIASSGRTALILALEAPLAAAFAWSLGAESFRWAGAAGGSMMLVAVVVADYLEPHSATVPSPPRAEPRQNQSQHSNS